MSVSSFVQRHTRSVGLLTSSLCLLSCTPAGQAPLGSSEAAIFSAQSKANFRLSLTDAPIDEVKSVFVNIRYAELRVEGGGKSARLEVARDLGAVDLLTLQNGVTLPMADLQIPPGVRVTQIRLILNSTGHYLVRDNGSRCDLQTPSAEKTGIKLLMKTPIAIESGYNYGIVADFDARKSLVLKGNGECLLKPVLKLKTAQRQSLPLPGEPSGPITNIDEGAGPVIPSGDETEEIPGEYPPVVDEYWEPIDPADLPPPVDERDLDIYFAQSGNQ